MERRRGPRDPLIRRRPRRQEIILLPPLPRRPPPPAPGRHAKLFAVALFFVVLAGAGLLATPWTTESGAATPPVDALFTAVSATAVTGLVTVETQEHWNLLGEVIILLLIQLGGLGFMVGASLVLQALRGRQTRLSDMVLIQQGEPTVTLHQAGQLVGRIVRFVFAVEAAGALLLTLAFWRTMPLPAAAWHGMFHAVSAFCNAGFDLQGGYRSLSQFETDVAVNVVVMTLIQAGALSYLVFADLAARRRWARLALDTKLVLVGNGVLLITGALVFLGSEWTGTLQGLAPAARPMVALFQSVATRTAGFATVNFGEVHTVVLFSWVAIMFIGGASGSTAGGAKISTVAVILASVISILRGRTEPVAFGRRLPLAVVFRAMTVVALMLIIHFAATLLLLATDDVLGQSDHSFMTLMFETMSALATVGLSTGITPELDAGSKLVLCVVMFIGRLGPLTAVYALQRRQQKVRYRFPEASVRIG